MTRISRSTPPWRLTWRMPGTPSSRLATVSSTNQLSCSIVMSVAPTAKKAISLSETSILITCGSRMPSGRSPRIWSTAFLTSLTRIRRG